MEKVIHICDKCGHEETYNKSSDSEYRTIKFLIGRKGSCYIDERYTSNLVTQTSKFLCKDCQVKMGIPSEKIEPSFSQQPELIDKVFELFESIADELGYQKN